MKKVTVTGAVYDLIPPQEMIQFMLKHSFFHKQVTQIPESIIVDKELVFYLFVKALEEDSHAFCEKAKKYELLLVAGDSFGYPGYVRISYCVSTEMIERSLPSFEKLAKEYK